MLSWLAMQGISRAMAGTRAGDIGPTLRMEAADVTLTFPGDSSWSGVHQGRAAVKRWLERLARVGIKTFPDEVVAKGWPWNMTVCVRGHDYLESPSGEVVYENRFVIWGHLAWGKLKEYEVYEDTQKAKALDAWLEHHEPQPATV